MDTNWKKKTSILFHECTLEWSCCQKVQLVQRRSCLFIFNWQVSLLKLGSVTTGTALKMIWSCLSVFVTDTPHSSRPITNRRSFKYLKMPVATDCCIVAKVICPENTSKAISLTRRLVAVTANSTMWISNNWTGLRATERFSTKFRHYASFYFLLGPGILHLRDFPVIICFNQKGNCLRMK